MKDVKSSAQANSSLEEKYKFKITSLEKTNEFLKLKLQDSEKKIAHEQELNNGLTKKLEKLQQKVSTLEKSQKDVQEKIPSEEPANSNEKPLDIVDLNNSQNQAKLEDSIEEQKHIQVIADNKNPSKGKVLTFDTNSGIKKKPLPTKPSTSEETKVLLNLIHNLTIPLKYNFPTIVKQTSRDTDENTRIVKSIDDCPSNDELESIFQDDPGFDMGKIFYPGFSNIIGNITELLPMLGKPYNIKHMFNIVEIYYKLLNFFFRFHVQDKSKEATKKYLTEIELQNSINKGKPNHCFFSLFS
jgi:hypothetical protein